MNINLDESETIVAEAKLNLTHNLVIEHEEIFGMPYTIEYFIDVYTNKKSGPMKCVWENGIVKELGQYKNDWRDGRFERWHPNGKIQSYCVFDMGRVLESASWSIEGVIEGENIRKGPILNRRTYWPNGNLLHDENVLGLKAHGIKRSWFINGQMKIDSLYHNGKRHQDYKEWNESGDLIVYRTYKHGKIMSVHV